MRARYDDQRRRVEVFYHDTDEYPYLTFSVDDAIGLARAIVALLAELARLASRP